jgi:hypothetical protein
MRREEMYSQHLLENTYILSVSHYPRFHCMVVLAFLSTFIIQYQFSHCIENSFSISLHGTNNTEEAKEAKKEGSIVARVAMATDDRCITERYVANCL